MGGVKPFDQLLLAFNAAQGGRWHGSGSSKIDTSLSDHENRRRRHDRRDVPDPALILFSGHSIAVSDSSQTEQFFAAGWGQHQGINIVQKSISGMLEAPGTVQTDVAWTYGDATGRLCRRLIDRLDAANNRPAVRADSTRPTVLASFLSASWLHPARLFPHPAPSPQVNSGLDKDA